MIIMPIFSLGNGDVQNKELEEEIKKEVERRYQKEITRELGKTCSKEKYSW